MSKLMKQIQAANPSLVQHQVLAMASKQLSRKKMVGGGGLHLEPYPRGRCTF